MNTHLDLQPAEGYHSRSQIGRVVTETWVEKQLYCPFCKSKKLSHFENNRPVADFFCPICGEEYELKSRNGPFTQQVPDGAYSTMLQRIASDDNPNFLFMFYSGEEPAIDQLLLIPKYYISTDMIQPRKPLAPTAKRAGWIGCNLNLRNLPDDGIIH